MKQRQKQRIGFASIATAALLLASFSLSPSATAGNEDTVTDIDKIETLKPGEVTAGSCDSVASDLEKRGRLEYDEVSGALKFVDAAKGD